MTTYTKRAATSGGFGRGQRVDSAQGSFSSGGGGARRREWWCQAGPVDSCCGFFSLRVGVGLLATSDLLNGIVAIFYLGTSYVFHLQELLEMSQSAYVQACSGRAAATVQCVELNETMEQLEGDLDVYQHLPISVYAQGFFSVVAGAVGLWAVYFRSKRAVTAYMLSWPAKFWLAVWGALDMRKLQMKYDVERGPTAAIMWLLHVVCLLYFFKVSWSYYRKTVASEEGARTSATYEEQPMLAVNAGV